MAIDFEDELDASVGLTLRDQFATAALTGILASPAGAGYMRAELTEEAYLIADAMLAARGGK